MEDSHLQPTTTMRGGGGGGGVGVGVGVFIHSMLSPQTDSHVLHRYQDILVCMMDSVVKKMLLHHNINELREIDDDAVDDDVREGKCESN